MPQEAVRMGSMAHPTKSDRNRLNKDRLVSAMKQLEFQSRRRPMSRAAQVDLDRTRPRTPKAGLQGIPLREDNSLFALPHA